LAGEVLVEKILDRDGSFFPLVRLDGCSIPLDPFHIRREFWGTVY
jgi:hypothetical protein